MTTQRIDDHIKAQSPDKRWKPYMIPSNKEIVEKYESKFMLVFVVFGFSSIMAVLLKLTLTPYILMGIAAMVPVSCFFILPKLIERGKRISTLEREHLGEALQYWAMERYGVKVPLRIASSFAIKDNHRKQHVFVADEREYLIDNGDNVFLAFPESHTVELPTIRDIEELFL